MQCAGAIQRSAALQIKDLMDFFGRNPVLQPSVLHPPENPILQTVCLPTRSLTVIRTKGKPDANHVTPLCLELTLTIATTIFIYLIFAVFNGPKSAIPKRIRYSVWGSEFGRRHFKIPRSHPLLKTMQ